MDPKGKASMRNRILAALSDEDLKRLGPQLDRHSLQARDLLYDVDTPIEHVYFPETCVASIVSVMPNGMAVEAATVGHEGMLGLALFHGSDRTSSQAFCQVPGDTYRLPAEIFRDEITRNPSLDAILHRYSLALFTLVGQSSACNRLHAMRERCARWLLHTHDRVGRDEGIDTFQITQQFLAQMLGVRRATVTVAMGELHRMGCVDYEMGNLTIRDRKSLEAVSCECYAIVQHEFERLLGDPSPSETASPLEGLKASEKGKSITREPDLDAETRISE